MGMVGDSQDVVRNAQMKKKKKQPNKFEEKKSWLIPYEILKEYLKKAFPKKER
jgi:hypothetical protein